MERGPDVRSVNYLCPAQRSGNADTQHSTESDDDSVIASVLSEMMTPDSSSVVVAEFTDWLKLSILDSRCLML